MKSILARIEKLSQRMAIGTWSILLYDKDTDRFYVEKVKGRGTPPANQGEFTDKLCHNLNNPAPNRNIHDFEVQA